MTTEQAQTIFDRNAVGKTAVEVITDQNSRLAAVRLHYGAVMLKGIRDGDNHSPLYYWIDLESNEILMSITFPDRPQGWQDLGDGFRYFAKRLGRPVGEIYGGAASDDYAAAFAPTSEVY